MLKLKRRNKKYLKLFVYKPHTPKSLSIISFIQPKSSLISCVVFTTAVPNLARIYIAIYYTQRKTYYRRGQERFQSGKVYKDHDRRHKRPSKYHNLWYLLGLLCHFFRFEQFLLIPVHFIIKFSCNKKKQVLKNEKWHKAPSST